MSLIDRFYWKYVWILTGFLFAVAGSLMLISGTFHLDCFYDVGKVYDVAQNTLSTNWNDTMYYDNMEQKWVVNSQSAVKTIQLMDMEGGWNYIDMSLSQVAGDTFDARIDFYDADSNLLCQMNTVLSEGDNLLTTTTKKFCRFDIVIENQMGLSFHIDKVQLRENEPVYSAEKFVKYLLPLFVGFLIVTGSILKFIRKRRQNISWYAPIHGIQKVFMYVGKEGEWISQKYTQKQRGWIRSGLFCFIFLLMEVSLALGIYNSNQGYRNLELLCSLALIAIAFLCWEKQLHFINWNNKLTASWFLLWVISMISDFVVEKRYAYMGYIMIFVVGFLFFMWGNMKHREWLIRDFIRGIQWSFLPNILFCWLFRPYIPGYRYSGSAHSPGIFAMYLLFVWLAFLAGIDFDFSKKILSKNFLCVAALGVCGDLLWKTQSISSLLPAVLAVLVFSLKLWLNRKKMKLWRIPIFFIVFVVGWAGNSYGVYNIPRMLGTEIKFEQDFYLDTVTEHPFTMTVRATEPGNENRLLYKLKTSTSLETLTTGRTLYWKGHLRELNLWGHKNKAYLFGANRFPHNGLIALMYRYGIFASIPYLFMVIYNLWYALKYFWRHLYDDDKYAFFVLADMLCCALLLLVENLELPLVLVCWYGMYIIMGVYFDDEKREESIEIFEKTDN